ncbi:MAG: hypothetical protein E6R11_07170 [Rhodocyclaceae bacterium]|nr:MAG: hypothetical protein EYC71_12610 [Gammaproteobacteria bacterium]TXG76998.1 MAG: hypothetical protein E6R11_07170 [Rhodocyclaceae bacterium]
MKSAPAIAFDYRPSRYLGIGVVLMTCIAVLAIAWSGLASAWKGILSAVVLLYAAVSLRGWVNVGITRIAHGDSGWRLIDRHGHEDSAELKGFLRRGVLLVLEFSAANGRRHRFLLAPGNSDAELRRCLWLVLLAQTPKQSGGEPLAKSEA